MIYHLHPSGICETTNVGERTNVWAFAHILPGAKIGSDCNICDHVFIENDVVIGDRVTVKCGVQIWDGIHVEDDVFIGPNASFANDKFPRSKHFQDEVVRSHICHGASIGANSTILPGVRIGQHAMVGAGTVVTRDVPPFAIVTGNPGRIVGYVNSKKPSAAFMVDEVSVIRNAATVEQTSVPGVTLHRLASFEDLRGRLVVGEFESLLPFNPRRFFLVKDVPSKYVRGEHAHRACEQFLACVTGSVSVVVDDGENRAEVTLDRSDLGVYVPPMVWAAQYKYTPDATLLVFASHPYDADDYVRDYDEFLHLRHTEGRNE